MKTILVTGANGFVGSNLCGYFADRGFRVIGLVRKTSDLTFLEGIDVDLLVGDLRQIETIDLPDRLDFVVHAAAVASDNATESQCREGIYDATRNLIDRVQHSGSVIPRFVYISTSLTLGYCNEDISEEHPGESAMYLPYVRYKKMTEDHLLAFSQENGFPCVILRPADIYGPKDRTSCLLMFEAAEKGIPLIVGRGGATFPYLYVDNLCQAVYLSCTADAATVQGQCYTVTNRSLPTWKEFFSHLQEGVSRKQRIYVPVSVSLVIAFISGCISRVFPSFNPSINYYRIMRATRTTTYDISKTLRDLRYEPEDDQSSQFDSIVNWYLDYRRARVEGRP